jgi:hypothetical protein
MPKFVWEITARGVWAPQLFHGELPREITAKENAHRYAVHELTAEQTYQVSVQPKPLDWLAIEFTPPAPEPRTILTTIIQERSNG